jgi:hypothetical protein
MEWESICISLSIALGVTSQIQYSDGLPELVKDEILGISEEGEDFYARASTNNCVEMGCTVCRTYGFSTHVLDTTMKITHECN